MNPEYISVFTFKMYFQINVQRDMSFWISKEYPIELTDSQTAGRLEPEF